MSNIEAIKNYKSQFTKFDKKGYTYSDLVGRNKSKATSVLEQLFATSAVKSVTSDNYYTPGVTFYTTIFFENGYSVNFWNQNRWYAFGSEGAIFDPNGHGLCKWQKDHEIPYYNILSIFADIYEKGHGRFLEFVSPEDTLDGFKCSCGGIVSLVTEKKKEYFVCQKNPYHKIETKDANVELNVFEDSIVHMEVNF